MTMTNIKLQEGGVAKGTGKRRRVKILAADQWGTSAYYPGTVLERDAEAVVVPGVKMYENHRTQTEEWERPEGDVAKLVGKLTSYGTYEAENPEGPGIYADVEFYDSYVPRINEIADDIGLSIRGDGITEEGEVDGRYGPIVKQLLSLTSVDVVTEAGAGGKIVSIIESAGPKAGTPIDTEGEQSVTALTKVEFEASIAQLSESITKTLTEAVGTMTTSLKEALAPEPVVEATTEVVVEGVTEPAAVENAEEVEPVAEIEIDHAAVITAIADAQLPSAVVPAVVTAVKEGKTVEEAVAAQTSLREAFVATAQGATHGRLVEAAAPGAAGDIRGQISSIFKK